MKVGDRLGSPAYAEGVKNFLTMARTHSEGSGRIQCPCRKCLNNFFLPLFEVESHLFIKGINPNYTELIFHGEKKKLPILDDDLDDEPQDGFENYYIDDMQGMLDDI